MITTAQQYADRFDWIIDGVHVLMLIKRKKDGGPTRTDRSAKKYISRNEGEWVEIMEKLLKDRKDGERIYCTVNSRNMKKGIRKFKQEMLDNDYQDQESMENFYVDIWNRLISALNKPSSKETKYFLIDIDEDDRHGLKPETVLKSLKKNNILIIDKYKTKNGIHIITEPFQYPKVMPELKKWDHVKVDGMALLVW